MDIQMLAEEIPVEGEHSLEGIDFITSGEQYLAFFIGRRTIRDRYSLC